MNLVFKNKIKPLYRQLMGELSQTPLPEGQHININENSYWEGFNKTVKLLENEMGEELARFLIEPSKYDNGTLYVETSLFRQRIGGLINYIHTKFFSEEHPPFGDSPQTVIEQSVPTSQNTQVQITNTLVSQIQEKFIEAESYLPEDSKERTN